MAVAPSGFIWVPRRQQLYVRCCLCSDQNSIWERSKHLEQRIVSQCVSLGYMSLYQYKYFIGGHVEKMHKKQKFLQTYLIPYYHQISLNWELEWGNKTLLTKMQLKSNIYFANNDLCLSLFYAYASIWLLSSGLSPSSLCFLVSIWSVKLLLEFFIPYVLEHPCFKIHFIRFQFTVKSSMHLFSIF